VLRIQKMTQQSRVTTPTGSAQKPQKTPSAALETGACIDALQPLGGAQHTQAGAVRESPPARQESLDSTNDATVSRQYDPLCFVTLTSDHSKTSALTRSVRLARTWGARRASAPIGSDPTARRLPSSHNRRHDSAPSNSRGTAGKMNPSVLHWFPGRQSSLCQHRFPDVILLKLPRPC